MRQIPGTDLAWDAQGFLTREVPLIDREAAVERDARCGRVLVGTTNAWPGDRLRLHYRLKMIEDVFGSGGIPTGEIKTTWAPKLKVTFEP